MLQTWLSKLNAKLMYLLLLHRKQVEQLDTFLAHDALHATLRS
jgi:hypothetical protein